MRPSKHFGNLTIRFEGSHLWCSKAEAAFDLQADWIEAGYGQKLFPEQHCYVFRQDEKASDLSLEFSSPTETRIHAMQWYQTNASLVFQMEAIKQGGLLLHANGFAIGNTAHVFAADGGVGKTAMLLALQNLGFQDAKFVGDDLVWITRDGRILPYLRPMCVYAYHYTHHKAAFKNHKILFLRPSLLGKAARLILRNVFAFLGQGFNTLNQRFAPGSGYAVVPVRRVFKNAGVQSSLALGTFNYLKKEPHFGIETVPKDQLLQRSVGSLVKEFNDVLNILNEMSVKCANCSFEAYATTVLERLQQTSEGFLVNTTGRWESEQISQLMEAVSGHPAND